MLHSAGKITLTTIFTAVFVFSAIFLFDLGRDTYSTAQAQDTATTSLTVLNIPPQWEVFAYEFTGASTNSPINSGDTMEWRAVANNDKDYWLIICESSATPTPTAASDISDHGNPANAPACDGGGVEWAVSDPTAPGAEVSATRVTEEAAPFDESNTWYGWVCDDDTENPRCNHTTSQGLSATNSSPFVMNSRPVLDSVDNDGPTLPGDTLTYTSVSSDPDTIRGGDDIILHVCATNSFANGSCDAGQTLASTTGSVTENADASFNIEIPTPVFTYEAYVFLVDEFDHQALNDFQLDFDVANATPEVSTSTISLNNGGPLSLVVSAGETEGFELDFTVSDNNSCIALDGSGNSLGQGSQFQDVIVSVYRESITKEQCGAAGDYDPNNCYPSEVGSSTWELTCTPMVSSCTDDWDNTGDIGLTMEYECDFPLWYVADPTDGTTNDEVQFPNEEWFAAVSVIDFEFATSSFTENTAQGVDVVSFTSFNLATAEIPYGALEPDEDTGSLIATTTVVSTGNTGIDQELSGTGMCSTFTEDGFCTESATSTIQVEEQEYGLDSATNYGLGTSLTELAALLEINVPKPVSTTTGSSGDIFWGIGVPDTISLSGAYTGQNTFAVETSNANNW